MPYAGPVTASLHKLTAGDGYTYLTRQVAVTDSTERGRSSLADYYTEKGERPGRWHGSGVAGLGSVAVGGPVTEGQMRALFGEGRHPDADDIQTRTIEAGGSVRAALKASMLGRAYPAQAGEPTTFLVETQRRYQQYNAERGLRSNAAVPEEVRARIRTEVGRSTFQAVNGRTAADDQELTSHITRQSRRPAQPVAGFDVTFTPVKSVSTLWAIAPREVAEVVEEAHDAAVNHALGWLEQEVAHTRRGAQGLRQAEVTGIVAAAFTHRDSRNGDPNLHTHVAIANKVQARSDGAWLSLDGAALYRAMVTVSEHYNSHLEAELIERLGVDFIAVEPERSDRRPIREVVGLPPELLQAWSSRRAQITAAADELARDFQERNGRAPSPTEMIQLAQQANLATRQAKHEPRSLAEQRALWRAQAAAVLGSEADVAGVADAACGTPPAGDTGRAVDPDVLRRVAGTVTAVVARSRARWQPTHVMAEAYRQLRELELPTDAIDSAVRSVTDQVVAASVPLTRADEVEVPDQLRRGDGTSVYEPKHTRLYTTAAVIDAEKTIVELALRQDGRTVSETSMGLALLEAEANGHPLNQGQVEMVRALSQSGRRVQLAIAPAGSGKTTAMHTLARAWTDSGGTIIGLAPSAVAADELRAAVPDGVVDTLAQLAFALDPAAAPGRSHPMPDWAAGIDEGTLVLVDEAGMAGTLELAAVIGYVTDRGGSVRLIGDDRQLAAVGAGGVLRDIQEAAGVLTLTELMRFHDDAEAAATLAVRDGDAAAVGFYLDRGRVHDAGDPAADIIDAWTGDVAAGRTALMVAVTRDAAAGLNERARARRIEQGVVDPAGPSATLRSGLPAAVGDDVLTRRNDRRNRLSVTDFVKNGDRWTVTDVAAGGALKVRHQGSGKLTWLAADYVQRHVDHAYAVTIHAAQGSTVDVSRILVDGSEDRQALYVALSRGRLANHVHLRTAGTGDPHNVIRPEVTRPNTATELLTGILGRDGREVSAGTTRRLAAAPQQLLRLHTSRYLDGILAAAEDLVGVDQLRAIEEQAEQLQPGVTGCGGWGQLRTSLALTATAGGDPAADLRTAQAAGGLSEAHDVAATLAYRLDRRAGPATSAPLPWLPAAAASITDHATWGPYLTARADQIRHHAAVVCDQAALTAEPPRWAEAVANNSELHRELAVWRAAVDIPDTDPAPAGRPFPPSRERGYQRGLETQVDRFAGPRTPVPAAVMQLLTEREPLVLTDPYWPVLARRLVLADQQGGDIEALVATALGQPQPLPEEQPAAALWFRIAGELHLIAATADADTRLRPEWTDPLLRSLPAPVGPRILTDPQWPGLVAAVGDTSRRTGLTESVLLDQVVGSINFDAVDVDAAATMLIWRLEDLTAEPIHDDELPADPDDPIDQRPDDLDHQAPDPAEAEAADPVAPVVADGQVPIVEVTEPPIGEPAGRDADPVLVPDGRLLELNAAAAAWWTDRYTDSSAARYVRGRLGQDLADDPRVTVGYAPPGWSNLSDHLQAVHGAAPEELIQAGLAKWSRRGSLIDLMRNRVMFGIRDNADNLVGFTGRAAPHDIDAPKWLNTPTTAIFTKGAVLFGYAENQDRLAAGATPVRVEGVMDALAVTLASDGRAVGLAPLGTALTAAQADLLGRAGQHRLILHATDNDPAGLKAAARDYQLLTGHGLDVRRLILTDGQHTYNDPAELYTAGHQAALTAALDAVEVAPPLGTHLIADLVHQDQARISEHAHAQLVAARQIGPIIAAAPSPQWEALIDGAARMLAAAAHDDPDYYSELLTMTTLDAAIDAATKPATIDAIRQLASTQPDHQADHVFKINTQLKSIAAKLASMKQRSSPAGDPGPASQAATQHRIDEHLRRGADRDGPGHGR